MNVYNRLSICQIRPNDGVAMEITNISQVRNLLLAAKSKAVIARELEDDNMLKEAENAAISALGRLVVSTPLLLDIIIPQLNKEWYRH